MAGKILGRASLRSFGLATWFQAEFRQLALAAVIAFASIVSLGVPAMAADGLISLKSQYQPAETLARLEAAVAERGLTVFARIDHAAGAAQVDLPLRPTVLLIFGNPKAGTALMQSAQTAGIDLPLRALVWQDADGTTWLSYNDVSWIAGHHGAGPEAGAAVAGMSAALQAIASQASGATPAK